MAEQSQVAAKDTEATQRAKGKGGPFGVLLELTGVAVPGRRLAFNVLQSILGEQGVDFSEPVFSRLCLKPLPEFYVPELIQALGLTKTQSSKLLEETRNGLYMHLQKDALPLPSSLRRVLEGCREQGAGVAALSALPEDRAVALMEKLGLAELGVELFCFDEVDETFPRADSWLKMVKSMGQRPRSCVALVSSHEACKSALSGGIHCVALPDEFTAFQDFGGADMVLDSVDELTVDMLDALLEVHKAGASR